MGSPMSADAGPLIQAVVTALQGAFGSSVFAQVAPDQTAGPYAVFTRVSTTPGTTLESGSPLRNTRLQVDVYSKTYAEVISLSAQAETAILALAYPIGAIAISASDDFEPDVKLHRIINEFSIWHP